MMQFQPELIMRKIASVKKYLAKCNLIGLVGEKISLQKMETTIFRRQRRIRSENVRQNIVASESDFFDFEVLRLE
jgi:hypothetical protein